MQIANKWEHEPPKSITPSGFFGNSINNIVEIKDFLSIEERKRLMSFALNNKVWDKTVDHVDEDGLVLYQASIWDDRVCTYNSLMASDPSILELINSMIARLKIQVDNFFDVDAKETGPAIVRWPVGARQEPHADKEFHAMSDNFFAYMMKNFEVELVVMGARIALTTYNLPFQPTKLKNFDEFHQRYGKYILQASA